MERTGLNDWSTQRKILRRVEMEEYKRRCWAVSICPWCGKDLNNIGESIKYQICANKKCETYGKTIPNNCI